MSSRKISRRDFLKLTGGGLALTAAGMALAGCAGATPTAAPPEKPTEAPTEAPTTPPEPVEITFWHQWGGVRTELLEAETAKFEEAHPNIKVNMVLHGWDEWPAEQLTAVAGGDPPELALGGGIYLPEFADSNALVPLGPYLEKEGIDVEQILYPVDFELAQWNSEIWMLPQTKNGLRNIMFCNKIMFEEAGLDPDKPPATWQELKEAAEAITVFEGGRLVKNGITLDDFRNWLITNDGEWISADARTALFNNPNAVETLEWMVEFADSMYGGWENVADTIGEDLYTSFYSNQEAMLMQGSWMFGLVQENAPEVYANMGIAPRPRNKGKLVGGVEGDDVSIWILNGSKNPDAAWELLRYLTIGEGGCNFMKVQVRPSPVRACNEDPYFAENNPWWDTLVEMGELEVAYPRTPVNPQVNEFTQNAVEQALFHKLTPKEALDSAVEEAQAVLDEAYA